MISLDVNNGCRLEVAYDHEKGCTVVTQYDHNNNVESRYVIEDCDFVTMLNWFRYQKENGNERLLF